MSNSRRGDGAVVIGGSMAGLLAARVLAGHFDRVTIIERDRLTTGFEPRKGVPQGRHAHGLLARGLAIVRALFPGMVEAMIADGAMPGDIGRDGRWWRCGGYKASFESGLDGVLMSRPLIEGHVRRRVLALPNVGIIGECDALGLTATADRARVIGVRLQRREAGTPAEVLPADLVVDAGGRGSRSGAWLESLGYERAPEEAIKIGVGYTTRLFRRRPGDLPGAKYAIIAPEPPRERRFGALFPIEGDRWMATLGGYLGDHAPADERGFLEFARSLPAPDIYDVIRAAEPLSEFAVHTFPSNLRRRYERLRRAPEGYLVTGDALCSFNPIYGQGMTTSALEAVALAECLAERPTLAGLPRRFYRRAARVIDGPWQIAAGADFAYPETEGVKAPGTDAINWHILQVLRAAIHDPAVYGSFLEVSNLLKPPSSLFHPRIVWRVLRANLSGRAPAAALAPAAPGRD